MTRRGRLYEWIFIAVFTASVLLWTCSALLDRKDMSELENRALASFPEAEPDAFFSGTFQDKLEEAMGDHLAGSESIRSRVRSLQASALAAGQDILYSLDPSLRSGYVQLSEGYWTYQGDGHRIVERPGEAPFPEEQLAALAENLNSTGLPVMLYFIENSRSVDFDRPGEESTLSRILAAFADAGFSPAACGEFTFSDYEDYCRWFYQTDHHWNNRGSYRGYREIIAMMDKGDPVPAGEETVFPFVFNGSYARQTNRLCADEPFRVYSFDLPAYTVTLNGKRGKYGRLDAYLKDRYETNPLTNHYANCYGGEYGEIVYDFGTEGKGTLLLIASSYSNPINALIASHFDRTVVVDPRYWEAWSGRSFDPAEAASACGADTILLLGDIRFFTADLIGEGGPD